MVAQFTPIVEHISSKREPQNWSNDNSNRLPTWNDVPVVECAELSNVADVPQDVDRHNAVANICPFETIQDTTDTVIQQRLKDIQSGWNGAELDSWIFEQFLGLLTTVKNLSQERLFLYMEWLIQELKAAGYKPKSKKQYVKLWKDIAKGKLEQEQAQKKAISADQQTAGQVPGRFSIRTRTLPEANDPKYVDPSTGQRLPDAPPLSTFQTECLYDNNKSEFLTNFTLLFDHEIEIRDEFDPRKVFEGTLKIFGRQVPFKIDAAEYADNKKLTAAITVAAGSGAVIHCNPGLVREAISTLSWRPDHHEVSCRVVTTDFGWNQDETAFLVSSGKITADGFTPVDEQTEMQVDLQGEEFARHLDLMPMQDAEELKKVKKHVVDDLLQLHDRRVTYPLLASVGAAAMGRFAPDTSPFSLWLVGLTGAGKSFAAKLFMNFFGKFAVTSGRFGAWASTSNFLQRQGYFFKDALYLIDDYKPEVSRHADVVRVLQNYSDRQGRGRLRADATTNTTRPIRGLLVSTGEDVPEHSASSIARSIIINVRQESKDLARGLRCMDQSRHYSSVTSDFIQQTLAKNRSARFAKMVRALHRYYYTDIAGEQNDSRIASNFALLGAGFVEMARYLSNVWPGWKSAVRQFLTKDLIAIRDEMVGATKEQQASEVFWTVLGNLVNFGVVELDGGNRQASKGTVIGRLADNCSNGVIAGNVDLVFISTDLALGAVNRSLKEQGRPELKISHRALLGDLRRAGRVFDQNGQPLSPHDTETERQTKQVRIGNETKRAFLTSRALLVGAPLEIAYKTAPGFGSPLKIAEGTR